MGLDMYLNAKAYVKDWAHNFPNGEIPETTVAQVTAKLLGLPSGINVTTVAAEGMYWRKANAIHRWFVENVQGGEDECEPHEVSRRQLQELIDLCKEVLADNSKAEDLLPTTSGFFFGNTDYDNWYFEDLQRTVDGLTKCLALPESFYFEYQSSW